VDEEREEGSAKPGPKVLLDGREIEGVTGLQIDWASMAGKLRAAQVNSQHRPERNAQMVGGFDPEFSWHDPGDGRGRWVNTGDLIRGRREPKPSGWIAAKELVRRGVSGEKYRQYLRDAEPWPVGSAFTTPQQLLDCCATYGLSGPFSLERLGEEKPSVTLFSRREQAQNRTFLRRDFARASGTWSWAEEFVSSILWLEAVLDGAGDGGSGQSWNFLATSVKTAQDAPLVQLMSDPLEGKSYLWPSFTEPPPLRDLVRRDDAVAEERSQMSSMFTVDGQPVKAILSWRADQFNLLRDCYKRWAWRFARMGLVEIGSDEGEVWMKTTERGRQAGAVIAAIFGPFSES
jgi:hypothetical protein